MIAACCFATQVAAQNDVGAPLSAIEWLTLESPSALRQVSPAQLEPPRVNQVIVPSVTVATLDDATAPLIGIIPAKAANLPLNIWINADATEIDQILSQFGFDLLPTGQDILNRLLLVQSPSEPEIVDLRVDRLMKMGAIEHSFALLGPRAVTNQSHFQRFFDASLLVGAPRAACSLLIDRPSLTDNAASQIYCTARFGSWETAALQFFTHDTLGDLPVPYGSLLGGFLDPDFGDTLDLPPVNPSKISPLEFRLRESIGMAVPSTNLSLPYVATDLQSSAGWREQLDAGERLFKAGAIPASRLAAIYNHNKPAASGGVWDRVKVFQQFDRAVEAQYWDRVEALLPSVWDHAKRNKLQSFFASRFAAQLSDAPPFEPEANFIRRRLLWIAGFGTTKTRNIPLALEKAIEGTPYQQVIETAFSENISTRDMTALEVLKALQSCRAAQSGDAYALHTTILALRSLDMTREARQLAVEFLVIEAGL